MTFNICNALNSEVLGCEPVRCKNWQGSEIPVEKRDEGRKLLLYQLFKTNEKGRKFGARVQVECNVIPNLACIGGIIAERQGGDYVSLKNSGRRHPRPNKMSEGKEKHIVGETTVECTGATS